MLSAEQVRTAAREQTGLADFGPPDFEEGLAVTLAALSEVPMLEAARRGAKAKLVHDLANRLRILDWHRANPQAAQRKVEGPLLVLGMPRTGTTATVAMLALDPRFRFLRGWEALQPLPPPQAGDESADLRVVAARAAADYANAAQHLVDPDGPEEDLAMLAGLSMQAYMGAWPMPDHFIDWWKRADFAPCYAMHRKVLELLHSARGPQLWLLKAPIHLFKLDAFAAEYPDARFVMTHRDPAAVIPSDCSLRYRLHSERCDMSGADKRLYGPQLMAFWREGIDRALASRARIGEERFVDLRNSDLVADPIGTFEALYAGLGIELSGEVRGSLAEYHRRNARGAHGGHLYSAEEYGLSRDTVRGVFADYCSRFGV